MGGKCSCKGWQEAIIKFYMLLNQYNVIVGVSPTMIFDNLYVYYYVSQFTVEIC